MSSPTSVTTMRLLSLIVGLSLPMPLVAQSPCPDPEAHEFDFWIGEWNVVNRSWVDHEWKETGGAEVQVFPAAGGCAIVELWDGNRDARRIRGFSLRSWSPARQAWVLVLNWPRPDQAQFGTLEGTFRHGRGEFFTRGVIQGAPALVRYSFADISPDRFRWNNGTSLDSGRTWATRWIMEYSRRPKTARPVLNLPHADAPGERACTAAGTERFDPILGRWLSSDSTVSYRSMKILDGCAIIDFLEWSDRDGHRQEAFIVRGWVHQAGRWIQYLRATTSPEMLRFEGSGPDSLAGETSGQRIAWQVEGDGNSLTLDWAAPGGPPSPVHLKRR